MKEDFLLKTGNHKKIDFSWVFTERVTFIIKARFLFLVLVTFNLEQDKPRESQTRVTLLTSDWSDFSLRSLTLWLLWPRMQQKDKPLSWYLKPRIGANVTDVYAGGVSV